MSQAAIVSRQRFESIDILRGLIMIIMALDHVRDFFHITAITDVPTNLATTTPQLFFTRWITHYCAPTFLFLAGTSAYIMGMKKTKKELSSFLIKRGIWLIFVELCIITLFITFDPFYHTFILQVIWAIGISMIILGLLVRLPYKLILVLGLIIVCGHNLLDFPERAHVGSLGTFWNFTHGPFSIIPLWSAHVIGVFYSFVAWTGIMLLGYCFGVFFGKDYDTARRKKTFLRIGLGLIVLFVILRWTNVYGDRIPWEVQHRGSVYTFLSFLNVNKYPPSLSFICMTLGPSILFLALIEGYRNRFTSFCQVYGRVPFFYYVCHFFLIHLINVIFFFGAGYGVDQIVTPGIIFNFIPPGYGYNLPVVYAVWIAVILIMYYPCKWFDRVKSSRKKWWLSYM
ncbi:MAG: hypothetical protein C5B52_10110 [Bacteroidetes bacterium]|nr:MAG: hypothetical protein C5B52_10110 [Bacteroidota bacterium]